MIYRDEIVFADRDGDVISVLSRKGMADPVITITRRLSDYDRNGEHKVMNSGQSQSVVFTEDEFRDFMAKMWERVLGEAFPHSDNRDESADWCDSPDTCEKPKHA